MAISLGAVDLLIVLLYLAVILFLGFRRAESRTDTATDYLLGGRRLTVFPFIATLVTTWYGGILGVGEFTYLNGVVNLVVFGLPYYFFALLYALFLAGRIRRGDALTIPERFANHFGVRSARFSALLVFLLATPAPYLLMLGVMANLMTGMPLWLGVILGTLVSTVYLWRGGFRSVVRTDVFQFVLMFAGFGILILLLQAELPWRELWSRLPAGHRSLRGPDSLPWQVILVWFFIASWTFVDPGFYQRCAAARDGATARRGIMISIAVWFCFDLLTTAGGLYAVVRLPELAQSSTGPMAAFPLLGAGVLPVGLRGLFFVALLAVIMSTVDSFVFIGATTLGRDLGRTPVDSPEDVRRRIRLGVVASGALGCILALAIPSVVELWYTLGSLVVPGLLVPILLTFRRKRSLSDDATLTLGLVGVCAAGLWQVGFRTGVLTGADGGYIWGLQPMLPGLVITAALGLLLMKRAAVPDD
ncbi:MAG: sodium:solute symporter family protein [Candidatus Neomarinimicrobiota bacterium]